ncbi:MAG TPA: DNA gyrase subunit A [Thermotogota bacterium]|nr:DNA gyrase subunit A [Thermotogota bacterium]
MKKENDKNTAELDRSIIIERPFEEELSEAYINYSMSVIIGRAIPDVRDGLKPVQRKILYGMLELNLAHNQAYKKSARIVGEVMGKYHPHGDASIYDALVRMAQDFNMRHPLVEGQGNFGSVDRDPAAAMRYTEARLAKIAEEMLADLEKDTVPFVANFDESLKEPTVLPSGVPNLLMNGASGIAVGMATNIPPHNLGELMDAMAFLIDQPEATIPELLQFVKGPDFPTGGRILGGENLRSIYETGTGSFTVEGIFTLEEDQIIVNEIPYGVNKAGLIEQIAEYFKKQEKRMIRDIRDESDRNGMRIVIEVAKSVSPQVVLNHVLKHSSIRTSFPVKLLVIDAKMKPRVMNLKELSEAYLNHRYSVIARKAENELSVASKRAHIIEGLIKAVRVIDTTIDIIRHSPDIPQATKNLMETLEITEEQAKAILDLRFSRLTSIETNNLRDELKNLNETIGRLKVLLSDPQNIRNEVKKLLLEAKNKYGTPRLTKIGGEKPSEVDIEDLVVDRSIVITVTKRGYILVSELQNYRTQARGGRGAKGIKTREEDFARHIMVTTKLANTLFVSSMGKVYSLKNYEIEDATKGTRGKHLMSYLRLVEGEAIRTVLKMGTEFTEDSDLLFISAKGKVKRTSLSDFSRAGTSGVIGLKLEEGDKVVDALLVPAEDAQWNVFIGTAKGMAIRFPLANIRRMGRAAIGLKGISLKPDDLVVSMTLIHEQAKDEPVLTVTTRGFGKRTPIASYRIQSRGGIGLKNLAWIPELGDVLTVQVINDADEVIIVTKMGYTIRFSASDIRTMGRVTRGVKVVDLGLEDEVASVERIETDEEPDTGQKEAGKETQNGEKEPVGVLEETGEEAETDIESENQDDED